MSDSEKTIHTGSCHCGAVRFRVQGSPLVVAHCHCEACQRLTGAGRSTGAMFPNSYVQLSGDIKEHTYRADNGNHVTKGFCPVCGSSIFGQNSGSVDFMTLSLGTFDNSSMFEAQVTIFAGNKKPWDTMDETLAAFDGQPDWKPDDH